MNKKELFEKAEKNLESIGIGGTSLKVVLAMLEVAYSTGQCDAMKLANQILETFKGGENNKN